MSRNEGKAGGGGSALEPTFETGFFNSRILAFFLSMRKMR